MGARKLPPANHWLISLQQSLALSQHLLESHYSSCSSTRGVNLLKSRLVKAELAGRAVGGRGPLLLFSPLAATKGNVGEVLGEGVAGWGGDAAGFNSRNTSHLSYCKRDVCLDAENALDPFFPPLAGTKKSREQSKNAADFLRLFWAPVSDCLLPRPLGTRRRLLKARVEQIETGTE